MMTAMQIIQLILNAYQGKPGNTEVIICNSTSGMMFNAVLRMQVQQLRDIYREEMERGKKDEWLENKLQDQTITSKEAVPTTDGVIIRGRPLK